MSIHVVAISLDPESLRIENLGHGGIIITIDDAKLEIAGQADHCPTETTGTLQLNLLPADMERFRDQMASVIVAERQRMKQEYNL